MPAPFSHRNNTWSAVVTPWAAKLNVTPELASIKVADILSGNTCTPLSLSDFEGYLLFKEHSVENLQFVVWYQDYRKRFFDSTNLDSSHGQGCDPSDLKFHVPNRASIERRAAENCVDEPPMQSTPSASFLGGPEQVQWPSDKKPEAYVTTLPESTQTSPIPHGVNAHPSISTVHNASGDNHLGFSQFTPRKELPFKAECMRIVATFLRPDSSKELSLDAIIRETIIRDLNTSTHPDIFIHAYREAYDMLETTSLPRFITHATINVNLQKQIYHYTVGLILFCISIIIAVSLIATVPIAPQNNRAWRLFAIPWFFCGCTTSYSSFRGFCSEVGGRGNLQLRAWELDEYPDDEAKIFTNTKRPQSTHSQQSACKNGHGVGRVEDANVFSVGLSSLDHATATAIAPFAEPFDDPKASSLHALFDNDHRPGRKLTSPKIFGPERVVEDPRIKAVHKRLLWEIYVVALCGILVFGAIIFSVPGCHRQ